MFQRINIIYFTQSGKETAQRIMSAFPQAQAVYGKEKVSQWTKRHFQKDSLLIYISACGIAVRSIAPLLKDKQTDPAVLVIDDQGQYVIPILSGHIGGANEAASQMAKVLHAQAIITTATDIHDVLSIDVFAKKNGLFISDMEKAKQFSADLLKTKIAYLQMDPFFSISDLRNDVHLNDTKADCMISVYESNTFCLIPKALVIGIGCKKGKSLEALNHFLRQTMKQNHLSIYALKSIHSIDYKKEEAGLKQLAAYYQIPFVVHTAADLNAVQGSFHSSSFVQKQVGVDNVCERAVCMETQHILVPKTICDGMTLAIGVCEETFSMKGC